MTGTCHRSPVDLAVREVTPVDAIGGNFDVQRHDILEHGDEARVVPLHQVYPPHFVPVGEDQGRASASCRAGRLRERERVSAGVGGGEGGETQHRATWGRVCDLCAMMETISKAGWG